MNLAPHHQCMTPLGKHRGAARIEDSREVVAAALRVGDRICLGDKGFPRQHVRRCVEVAAMDQCLQVGRDVRSRTAAVSGWNASSTTSVRTSASTIE